MPTTVATAATAATAADADFTGDVFYGTAFFPNLTSHNSGPLTFLEDSDFLNKEQFVTNDFFEWRGRSIAQGLAF